MRSGDPPSPRLQRARSSLRFALRTKRRLERVTRLELATSSLARRCSTTELHPRKRIGIIAGPSPGATFFHRDKMASPRNFLNLKLLSAASHQQMKPMKALVLGSVASFGITL